MQWNYLAAASLPFLGLISNPQSACAESMVVQQAYSGLPVTSVITTTVAPAPPVIAQSLPPVIFPPRTPAPLPIPATPPETPSIESPETPAVPDQIEPTAQALFVSEFRFVGNTVLSTAELNQAVAPFLNRALTFEQLLQVRSAITQLYVSKGYTTSGAFIPITGNESIDPENAAVTIQIVEGRVESIEVTGTATLRNYVRQRIAPATAPVFNQNTVEEALRLLQIDPLVETISANLSAGSQPGLNRLSVSVTGTSPFTAGIQLDNSRVPSVGEFQRGAQFGVRNLLGLGETLAVEYAYTDGSNQLDADFSVPFNSSNGTISLSYSTLSSRIIEEPFNVLDIEGSSRLYQVSIRQPVLRRASPTVVEELALGISATRSESTTTVEGQPFPISPGADADGQTRINAVRFFQEYSQRTGTTALAARSQFSLGLNVFDATILDAGPDAQFFTWRGQILWANRLFGDSRLLLRADLQLADRPLVPAEQFSLGGSSTVRGYRQDLLLGDNGLSSSAELQIPILNTRSNRLDLIPFLDGGVVWNNGNEDRTIGDNTLLSTGIGLQYQWGGFSARLNYAFPLLSIDAGSERTEDRLDFTVRYVVRF